MAIEIERRFLVVVEKLGTLPKHPTFIKQSYLSKSPAVRVRTSTSTRWDTTVGYLTVKGKGTIARPEYEYEIPEEDARDMMLMAMFGLAKHRYIVPHGFGHEWEVDEFLGSLSGLWLAEIELGQPNEAFERPPWLGREVTEDSRYSNVSLAEHGLPRD